MSRTQRLALSLLLTIPLACSSTPESGSTPTQDAGTTATDAGGTLTDAGDITPDAGDPKPDAGDTTPDAGMPHEITGALVRVFNLNLPSLTITKGTNPATDAIPEFNTIAKLTLTNGPHDGYVEIPLQTTLHAWVGGPSSQQFTLPGDATAGARYTAVATLRGLRLLADVPPTTAGGRRVVVATDRDVVTLKSEGDQTLAALSAQNPTVSFEVPAAEGGFFIETDHLSTARIPADGVGAFVLDQWSIYHLKTPGPQATISRDTRVSFVSLSFALTNGADATLTATTPLGDFTVGSAGYEASSGAPKWVPMPITKFTATSTLGSATLTVNEPEGSESSAPTVVVASDRQGTTSLTRISNESDDTAGGGQKYLLITNLTGNPLRYGVPYSGVGNGTMWFPEQQPGQAVRMVDHGTSVVTSTTGSGTFDVQVSVNADSISDLTTPVSGIVNKHSVLHYASSVGKYAFARLKADGSLVITLQP